MCSSFYSNSRDIYDKELIKGEDLGTLTDSFISMMSSYLNFDVNAYLKDKSTYLANFNEPIDEELAKEAQDAQNAKEQAQEENEQKQAEIDAKNKVKD